ncbi:MAG: hypothetical protein QUS11_10695 [Candidatus Fermentibacter sp.]|nr:hypothetical protein [Candidatus Fermentibacter sp.]
MARRATGYEQDDETFTADAYRVQGHGGVAFRVLGWETEPDEDTEWSGREVRTGKVVAVMVGDDHRWKFDPEEVTPLGEDEYCQECGQIGCGWVCAG